MDWGIVEWGDKPLDEYLSRVVELIVHAHHPAKEKPVKEALLVKDGPIDSVLWVILEDYRDHVVFIRDASPDKNELRRLHSWQPTEDQLPRLKAYFRQTYGSVRSIDVRLVEIPDTYQPQIGQSPVVNIGIYYDPEESPIKIVSTAAPFHQRQRILEDINKLVPATDLETFLHQIDMTFTAEVQDELNKRIITGDIPGYLKADADFRKETIKPIPDGTHPDFDGQEAELWQKPVSRIDYIEGSQGFLQVWRPVDNPEIGIVSATQSDYDESAVVDQFRHQFDDHDSVSTDTGCIREVE